MSEQKADNQIPISSDKPIQSNSSEASKSGETLANAIERQGWWQGSIVTGETLTAMGATPAKRFEYWVLASQTCNIYNVDFDKIHSVEWVGANPLKDGEVKTAFAHGRNPRILHSIATTADSQNKLNLSCDIQARVWTDRKFLEGSAPHAYALRDEVGDKRDIKQKDIFIGWLSKSYTRIELSNELGEALKRMKFDVIMEKFLQKHEKETYGIFLILSSDKTPETLGISADFDPEAENPETTAVENAMLENPVLVKPPCAIELHIVMYNNPLASDNEFEKRITEAKTTLENLFKQLVPSPAPEHSHLSERDRPKIARKDLGKIYNVRMSDAAIKFDSTSKWNINNLNGSIRYSFNDFLSSSNEPETH